MIPTEEPRTTTHLAIRGFAHSELIFEDRIEVHDSDIEGLLPALAEKHADAMAANELGMIEIEFLDEPDPLQRFFRFGTDPAGMKSPIAVPHAFLPAAVKSVFP